MNRFTAPAQPIIGPRFLGCLLITVITAAVFSPVLKNGFTNWDDDVYVTNNQDIRGINLDNLKKIFSKSYGYYHPLPELTFMLDNALSGLEPRGYHATNVLLHCINAVLVFALISALSGRRKVGFLAALLFAVHPLRVESVVWITERKGLLSSLFYLASLLAYVRYAKRGGVKSYCSCALFFVFSLLSKPMAVSAPFVMLGIDHCIRGKIDRRRLLEKAPFIAAAAVWIAVSYFTQQNSGAISQHPPLFVRLCLPFYGLLFNVFTTVVPLHLSALYPVPLHPDSAMKMQLFLSPPLAVGLAWMVFYSRKYSRKMVFGALFSLFTLLPVLQIVPAGSAAVADRYTYLAAIGIAFIFAEGVAFVYREKTRNNRTARGWLLLGLAVLLFTCGGMAYHRCGVWKDSVTLWNDVLRHYPSAIAYNNRGTAYVERGRTENAIDDFSRALALNPDYAGALTNRGIAYRKKGSYDSAVRDFDKAISLDPGDCTAREKREEALAQLRMVK